MCAGGATERFLQERKKLLCLSFFGQCKEIRSRTDSVSFMVAIYLGFLLLLFVLICFGFHRMKTWSSWRIKRVSQGWAGVQ